MGISWDRSPKGPHGMIPHLDQPSLRDRGVGGWVSMADFFGPKFCSGKLRREFSPRKTCRNMGGIRNIYPIFGQPHKKTSPSLVDDIPPGLRKKNVPRFETRSSEDQAISHRMLNDKLCEFWFSDKA
jgi:hypothetical protein